MGRRAFVKQKAKLAGGNQKWSLSIPCPRKFALFEVTVWLGEYTGHIVPLFSTGISREAHTYTGRGAAGQQQINQRLGLVVPCAQDGPAPPPR